MNDKDKQILDNLTLEELRIRKALAWRLWGVVDKRLDNTHELFMEKAEEQFYKSKEYKAIEGHLKECHDINHHLDTLILLKEKDEIEHVHQSSTRA